MIAHVLRTKAQVISARSKGNASVFFIYMYMYYDVKMSTKSKTDNELSCITLGEIP